MISYFKIDKFIFYKLEIFQSQNNQLTHHKYDKTTHFDYNNNYNKYSLKLYYLYIKSVGKTTSITIYHRYCFVLTYYL